MSVNQKARATAVGFALTVLGFIACDDPLEPGTGGLTLNFAAPAQSLPPVDSWRATATGPSSGSVTGAPGETVTIDSLQPGDYIVVAEGLESGVAIVDDTVQVTVQSGQNTTANIVPQPIPDVVTVTPPADTVFLGNTITLAAEAQDPNGNIDSTATFTWTSSDAAIATVDAQSGVVTPVSHGAVSITATIRGVSDAAAIEVDNFVSIDLGVLATCGITARGGAYCWGRNPDGQLGNNTTSGSPVPTLVGGGVSLTSVSAGDFHTCGIASAGPSGAGAYCWGRNTDGQLGINSTTRSLVPAFVTNGAQFTQVEAATRNHTCALTMNGTASCWGDNQFSQLGDGLAADQIVPTAVSTSLRFATISLGSQHTCATEGGGDAYCWGDDGALQMGNGAKPSSPVPDTVMGGLTLDGVTAGQFHNCAIAGNVAYCWGTNNQNQLGDGTATDRDAPVAVSTLLRFDSVAAGGNHTCGLVTDGEVHCWGRNAEGQLGDGSNTPRSLPVRAASPFMFVTVRASLRHTCGIANDNATYCWGQGTSGELGDGRSQNSPIPVLVTNPG